MAAKTEGDLFAHLLELHLASCSVPYRSATRSLSCVYSGGLLTRISKNVRTPTSSNL